MLGRLSVFAMGLVAFGIPDALANRAQEVREPVWAYLEPTRAWCLSINPRLACLPRGFELQRFEPGHARWKHDDGESVALYLTYYDTSQMGDGDAVSSSREFEVRSTEQFGGVTVFELVMVMSQSSAHATSLFVLEFQEGFSLRLYSQASEAERMRNIAEAIADAWNERGSQSVEE